MIQDLRVVFAVAASITTVAAAQPVFPTVTGLQASSFNAADLQGLGIMEHQDDSDSDVDPPFVAAETTAQVQAAFASNAESRTTLSGALNGSGYFWRSVNAYSLGSTTRPAGQLTRQAQGDWSISVSITLDEASRATFGITQGNLDGASVNLFEPLVITGSDGVVLDHDPSIGNAIYTIDLPAGDYTLLSRQQWSASTSLQPSMGGTADFRVNAQFRAIPAPSVTAVLGTAAVGGIRRRR